ncbi:MAG: hypothetical protein IH945_07010, partial [Armatimonadetes bacterium]|nr:hypothetical protein [Armatimonadota bacterium]
EYSQFRHDMRAQVFRAATLSRYYQSTEDWRQAEHWIKENIRLMREHEAKGLGLFALDSALEELKAVRKRLARAKPGASN